MTRPASTTEASPELGFRGAIRDSFAGLDLLDRRTYIAEQFNVIDQLLVINDIQNHSRGVPALCENERTPCRLDSLNELRGVGPKLGNGLDVGIQPEPA